MATNRPRGTGSVYERPDGLYVATFPLPSRGGRRQRRVTYHKTKPAANAWLRDEAKKLKPRSAKEERYTVGDLLTDWLGTLDVKPSTKRRYDQIVRYQLRPVFGGYPLGELRASDIRRGLQELHRGTAGRKPLSARSVSHCRAVLRTALGLAVADQRIASNPAVGKHAAGPEIPDAEPEYLDLEAVKRMLAVVPSLAPDASPAEVAAQVGALDAVDRLGALYVLATFTGLRQGELLGLRWQDVDLEAGLIHVRHSLQRDASGRLVLGATKTKGSKRPLPIPTDGPAHRALVAHRARMIAEHSLMLDAWRGAKWTGSRFLSGDTWRGPKSAVDADQLVFTSSHGTPLPGTRVTEHWHRFTDRHGLPTIRFHALRHTMATMLGALRTDPRTVSDLLGHTTTKLLQVYQHVQDTQRVEAVTALGDLFSEEAAR